MSNLHYDNCLLLSISTNLSLPLDITLVISLGKESVTLACYSNLLIGLCHKKNVIYFGVECCPYPIDTQRLTKTQNENATAPSFNQLTSNVLPLFI